MDTGVEGYFQFIQSGRYKVNGITDPEQYLQALKDGGYATSPNYVQNNMRVIDENNLRRFDGMIADSSLVKGVIPSPNYSKRKYTIDTIIIHCMAGTYDAKRCGQLFADPKRQASSHYGISSNGEIYQYVNECNRAWTTGGDKVCNGWTGSEYDHRSITMEVSNSTLAPDYQVTPQCMTSIINLCADICKRHGIKELKWSNNPKLVGNADLQNMAVHRWFASKSCPGNFLMMCMPNIALTVNQRLAVPEGFILNGYDYSPVYNVNYVSNNDREIVISAYSTLVKKLGNCYDYACTLAAVMQRIGYDTHVVHGFVGMSAGGYGNHYWVDTNINGRHYIFDAQVENNNLGWGGTVNHYFYCLNPNNTSMYIYQETWTTSNFRTY